MTEEWNGLKRTVSVTGPGDIDGTGLGMTELAEMFWKMPVCELPFEASRNKGSTLSELVASSLNPEIYRQVADPLSGRSASSVSHHDIDASPLPIVVESNAMDLTASMRLEKQAYLDDSWKDNDDLCHLPLGKKGRNSQFFISPETVNRIMAQSVRHMFMRNEWNDKSSFDSVRERFCKALKRTVKKETFINAWESGSGVAREVKDKIAKIKFRYESEFDEFVNHCSNPDDCEPPYSNRITADDAHWVNSYEVKDQLFPISAFITEVGGGRGRRKQLRLVLGAVGPDRELMKSSAYIMPISFSLEPYTVNQDTMNFDWDLISDWLVQGFFDFANIEGREEWGINAHHESASDRFCATAAAAATLAIENEENRPGLKYLKAEEALDAIPSVDTNIPNIGMLYSKTLRSVRAESVSNAEPVKKDPTEHILEMRKRVPNFGKYA